MKALFQPQLFKRSMIRRTIFTAVPWFLMDIAAEVFPSEIRAAGHGFAAASAKFGAALGVFLFPILMDDIGTSALLFITAGACAVGFVVTWLFRIEPRGRSLDEVSGQVVAALAPRPVPP